MHDPTREAAFDLISAVLDRHCPLEDALDRLPALQARDKAAAHRLAASVLRRLGSLDAVLQPLLRKPPPDAVRHVLRLGAAALLLLQTPAHAAVATGVSLARARGLAPFTGLVNAVLRRLVRDGSAALADIDGPRIDTPDWLWESWGEEARAIGCAHQAPAPIDLTIRTGHAPPEGELLPTGSIRVPAGTRAAELPGYAEGAFWVQDAAAALPARLLNARQNEFVGDLCAAPGGKTAQLAATGARVVAVERDAERIIRLRENLKRLRLDVEIVRADAAEWEPPAPLDAVLLDAPCSATGTIRRHPDVARIKSPPDVRAATAAQDRLLARAGRSLRPGGRLLYAVCSLQQEEGRPRIERLLAGGGWRADPFTSEELADAAEARTPDGYLRTHPGMWAERGGMDGFFAARLVRL